MVTCVCFDVGMGVRVVLSPGEGACVGGKVGGANEGEWVGRVRGRGREGEYEKRN